MKYEKMYNETIEETLYHGVSEAGLNVYVLPKKGFSKKYAVYSVNFGSCDISYTVDGKEITDPLGIAHFLEHKLFEMPDGRNAFDLFANTGASANAFTSNNMTAYLFSASEGFDESLDILLNYVNEPYFTDENVEKEQGIIAQEIKMYDDDPQWRLYNNVLGCLYKNNPIRDDIAGSVESISHITKETLYNAYNAFYRPENMVLFITGDVDMDKISELVEKNVKKKEPKNVVRKKYMEPEEINEKSIVKNMSVSKDNYILGFKDNEIGLKGEEYLLKNIEVALVLKMLFSEFADLYNELYQKGIINDTFSYENLMHEDYSAVLMGGETDDVERSVKAIIDGINKVKEKGFTKEEFDLAKKSMWGRQIRSYNSLEAVANSFCSNFFLGINAFDFVKVFEKITLESVNDRLSKMFDNNYYSVSVVKPEN